MSEEEVIKVLKNHAQYTNAKVIDANTRKEYKVSEAIDGLLDLYNKEKEKNKELEKELITESDIGYHHAIIDYDIFYISKDKIIKLLNKYDKESFIAKVDLQELLEERN